MFDTLFTITAMGNYSHNNPCEIQEAPQQVDKPFADKGRTNPFPYPFFWGHGGHYLLLHSRNILPINKQKQRRRRGKRKLEMTTRM